MADEEVFEGEETLEQEIVEEPEGVQGAEFVPQGPSKPKSDVYTLILILTFVAFLTATIIAGKELYENYDVQFWVFEKEDPNKVQNSDGSAPPGQ